MGEITEYDMRIHGVSGGYPGGFLLENINFTVGQGEMCALLGLNGSGKSTIIKMICGLLKPISGSVFVGDVDILKLKEKERARLISYVPQHSDIIYETSVIDVVLMGVSPYLRLFETPKSKHILAAHSCLGKLGIGELAYSNYQTLSGGQKQIVIIARALLQDGRYMILDEPDSNLDLINKNKLMKKIRQITDDYNKGCLISMHNPEYALNYCDNIILLKDKTISKIDLNRENIDVVEKKLSEVYGDIKILRYKEKYILYYE